MLMEELEELVPPQCRVQVGGTRVLAIGEGLEFGVDAIVVEQDMARVLGPAGDMEEPAESFPRLVNDMVQEKPPAPGSVLVESGYPLRLHAIVHDLDRQPTWETDWVRAALEGVREQLAARSCKTLLMPMLAVRHGSMEPEDFIVLLRDWLGSIPGLETVYLEMPADVPCSVLTRLQDGS